MDLRQLQIGIIGGSLGGLSAANVLARAGATVTILERRRHGFERRGGGLGFDPALAARIVDGAEPAPHLMFSRRRVWISDAEFEEPIANRSTSYGALWRWLHAGVAATSATVKLGVSAHVDDPGSERRAPQVMLTDAQTTAFDLVVLADGGASRGRVWLGVPESTRRYAGYVLWRGLVAGAALDPALNLLGRFHIASVDSHHFVAYPIPDADGRTAPAARILNWGWYFPLAPAELTQLVGSDGGARTPHAIEKAPLPEVWRETLDIMAGEIWPAWVQQIVTTTQIHGRIASHPVYQFEPTRLVHGRLALLGDAAHLASPITGSGARMAMHDALALGAALREGVDLDEGLAIYERQRLEPSRAIVRYGHAAGESFRASSMEKV